MIAKISVYTVMFLSGCMQESFAGMEQYLKKQEWKQKSLTIAQTGGCQHLQSKQPSAN